MSTNRSFSFSHGPGRNGSTLPLYSDNEVLTRDSDLYVRKIELEVKKLHNIKRAFNLIKKDRDDRKDRLQKQKGDFEATVHKNNSVQNQHLLKQKQFFQKKHDELVDKVSSIRRDIDVLRRERIRQQNVINKQSVRIEEKEYEISDMSNVLENTREVTFQQQEEMYEIGKMNEKYKDEYNQKIDKVHNDIEKQKHKHEQMRYMQSKASSFRPIESIVGSFDTATILKRKLQKSILKNKEKVKIIDTYMRHLSVIDNAFNQIKEATGITDINEIQNTFIKAEEQNHSLLTYYDILNQQIDSLNDKNQVLLDSIKNQEDENRDRERLVNSTPTEVKEAQEVEGIISKKQSQVDDFQGLLDTISPEMEKMLKELAGSKFNANPNKEFEYKNGITLNDKNIENYFGDLEEFTNRVLTHETQKNKLPYTTTLLADEIPVKVYGKTSHPMNYNYNRMDQLSDEKDIMATRKQLIAFAQQQLKKDKQKNNKNYDGINSGNI